MNRNRWKLRHFSLTLVLLGSFSLSLTGQIAAGWKTYNQERAEKRLTPAETVGDYLSTGHFLSSVSENMESEFLQMALFVVLTAFLVQRGSAESRKPPEDETTEDHRRDQEEESYRQRQRRLHPVAWRIYEQSLSVTLILLFLLFFGLHALGTWKMINEHHQEQGLPAIPWSHLFGEPQFWFESFQNRQSEFFSIAVLGVFSIFLRQRGSPQSKRLDARTTDTGSD